MKAKTKKIKRIKKVAAVSAPAAPPLVEVMESREKKRGDGFTTHGTTSRLQEGMIIFHAGSEYVVEMVNECRARCRPLNTHKKQVSFTNAKGKTFNFQPEMVGATINISPNSECEIVRWQRAA